MGEAGAGHVFLSHNAQDKPEVERLARQLLDRGLRPWLDKWEIVAGSSWQEALQGAIEQASAVLVCVGEHGLGRVQLPEVEAALDRAFQDSARLVVPVFLPGAAAALELPPFLKQRSWVDLRRGEAAYRQLFAALGTGSLVPAPRPPAAEGSPFRGLEAFEECHARWFFGREAYLARLLAALREQRLLAVIGASGSGKSSLVRAGLVPAVRTGELDQSYAWVPLLLRPGPRPLHELALRVANALSHPREVSALREGMLREPGLLADELDREAVRGASERRFLVVVDQFEELFTLCEEREARAAFIAALVQAASAPGGRTHVVWTLRADFAAQLLEQPGVAQRLDRCHLLLGPMSGEELRSAIRRPALIAGLELEAGLEDLLVQSTAGEPGDLPLLQFALDELWQQREGARLTLAAYRRMGGLKGAIARRADAELAKLDGRQKQQVRQLFGRLVHLGEGTADTRQRLSVGALAASHPELQAPLESLIRARLLTAHEQEVEVAHEALIREWGTLREWIESDRELLRVQHELSRAAALWQQSGETADLWGGGRLTRALELRAAAQLTLSAPENSFLDAAQAEAEREARAQREHQQRELESAQSLARSQASAARRLRAGLASAAVLLVALACAAYAAIRARGAAQQTIADAIGVASVMVEAVDRDLADVAGASEVRAKILESGAALLDRLRSGVAPERHSEFERNRAAYHEQRAELAQGAQDLPLARSEYEAALAIRTRLAEQDPADTAAQLSVAVALEKLGGVLVAQGEAPQAHSSYERAIAIREGLAQGRERDRSAELALAATYRAFAGVVRRGGDSAAAERWYQKSLELVEHWAVQSPDEHDLQRERSRLYRELARFVDPFNPERARGRLQRALEIDERLAREQPNSIEAQRELAQSHNAIGIFAEDLGELSRAQRAYDIAAAICQRLLERDPLQMSLGLELAKNLSYGANVALTEGRLGRARSAYQRAITQLEAMRARGDAGLEILRNLDYSLRGMADTAIGEGRLSEALALSERSLALHREMAQRRPESDQVSLTEIYARLGTIAQRQGRLTDARKHFEAAREIDERMLSQYPREEWPAYSLEYTLKLVSKFAQIEGRFTEARRHCERAIALAQGAIDRNSPHPAIELTLAESHDLLAEVADAEGDSERAATHRTQSLATYRSLTARQPENPRIQLRWATLEEASGRSSAQVGRRAAARVHYAAALKLYHAVAERQQDNTLAQLGAARLLASLAGLDAQDGQRVRAAQQYRESETTLQMLAQRDPGADSVTLELARTSLGLARVLLSEPAPAAARESLERARRLYDRLAETNPESALVRDIADTQAVVAELARHDGNLDAAHSAARSRLQVLLKQVDREPSDFGARRALVAAALDLAAPERASNINPEAAAYLEQALAAARDNLERSPTSADARRDLETVEERIRSVREARREKLRPALVRP